MPGFKIGGRESSGPSSRRELARSHRWLVSIPDFSDQGLNFFAHSCDRPVVEFDVHTIHQGQNRIYAPGRHKWNPITIKFYEILSEFGNTQAQEVPTEAGGIVAASTPTPTGLFDSTANELYKWWSSRMLNVVGNYFVSPNIADLKKETVISLLDGAGGPIWKYTLHGSFPSKVAPTGLSYSETGMAEISVTLQYDAAQEEKP